MSGSVIRLIKKYGSEKNLKDYKLFKPDAFITKEDKEIISVSLPEGYKKLSESNYKTFKYRQAIEYLAKRGITDDIIKKYDIGFTTQGQYFNRIIIPSYDADGVLNYFIARWFDKKYNKIKYLNPEAEKQNIIFNEYKINWDANIYLVEGVTDHIVVPNSIPLLGKYISEILLYKLREKAKANIIILLDGDAYEDALFLYQTLDSANLRGRIRICVPNEAYDPSLINEKFGRVGIIELLKNSFKLNPR
jgi:DNA primase